MDFSNIKREVRMQCGVFFLVNFDVIVWCHALLSDFIYLIVQIFILFLQVTLFEISFLTFQVASPAEFVRMFGGNKPIEKVLPDLFNKHFRKD